MENDIGYKFKEKKKKKSGKIRTENNGVIFFLC